MKNSDEYIYTGYKNPHKRCLNQNERNHRMCVHILRGRTSLLTGIDLELALDVSVLLVANLGNVHCGYFKCITTIRY